MDVILPLHSDISKTALQDNLEAKFCIYGLFKNFKDLNRLFIVTNTEVEIDSVNSEGLIDKSRIIYVNKGDDCAQAKDAVIIDKIAAVISAYPDLSEDFLFISDDQLFIKPTYAYEIVPLMRKGITGSGIYRRRVQNTLNRFENPKLMEPHQPNIFNKTMFKKMISEIDYIKEFESVVIYTLYFNYVKEDVFTSCPIYYHVGVEDDKIIPDNCKILAFWNGAFKDTKYRNLIKEKLFSK